MIFKRHSRSSGMTWFNRTPMISYWRSIVTTDLSRIVFKTWWDIGWKSQIFGAPIGGDSEFHSRISCVFCFSINLLVWSCSSLNWLPVGFWLHVKHLHSDSEWWRHQKFGGTGRTKFSGFDAIRQRDRQTDRHRTTAKTALASRCKKLLFATSMAYSYFAVSGMRQCNLALYLYLHVDGLAS